MSEEEKKAIQKLNIYKEKITFELYPTFNFEEEKALGLVLNLIEKQNNRLEQLEKENKELKESHDYIYEAYQDAGKKMFDYQEQLENSIPKSVIREKIEELEGNREKIEDKYYFDYQNNIYDFIAGMKKGLKELLGEEK